MFLGIHRFKEQMHTIKNVQLVDLFTYERPDLFNELVIDEYVFHVSTIFKFLTFNTEIDNGEDKNEIIEEFLFKYLSSLSSYEVHFNLYYLLVFHTHLAQTCSMIVFQFIENLPHDPRKEFLNGVADFKIRS